MTKTIRHQKKFLQSLIIFLVLKSGAQEFQNVDARILLFGHEATFQNLEIASESGDQNLFSTPEKRKKALEFIAALKQQYGDDNFILTKDSSHGYFKPFWSFKLKRQKGFKLDMEPQTLEFVQPPVTASELKFTWSPIYAAADKSGLVGSVYASGVDSGSGHFHVGVSVHDQEDNPFKNNPVLLRNILVLFHQNPALLFGFASAHEAGPTGYVNMFPFADVLDSDAEFKKMVQEFDESNRKLKLIQAYSQLVPFEIFMKKHRIGSAFFGHDVFINLEHLNSSRGTVEFRNIRPMQSSEQVEAMGYLLLALIDYSAKDRIIPLKKEPIDVNLYLSNTNIENNWEQISEEIKLPKKIKAVLTEMIKDLTRRSNTKQLEKNGVIVTEALSRENKAYIELKQEFKDNDNTDLWFDEKKYNGKVVTDLSGKKWKIAVIKNEGKIDFKKFRALLCKAIW